MGGGGVISAGKDTISTLEDVQHCKVGKLLKRMFSTVEDIISTVGDTISALKNVEYWGPTQLWDV